MKPIIRGAVFFQSPISLPLRLGWRAVFISSLCLLAKSLALAATDELRAGLARIDITPTQPVRMAGYESRKELSQGVHDPLSARAVAFEQNGHRLVLVSVDTLGLYNGTAEPLRKAILETCGVKPSELFLCAIHTHSAPTLMLDADKGPASNVEYTKTLQTKLPEVVRAALQRLAPVELAVGSGSSPVGVCRREVVQDNTGKPKIILGRNPSVLTDKEVQVLKFMRPGQTAPLGVLFAYATHSTSLGPKNYSVSGDIHGLAEQFLERYYGAELVAPGFAGASGDIDPWVRVLPEFRTENGWLPEPVLMGTMLGEEVARVVEATRAPVANTTIRAAMKTVLLPGKETADSQSSTPPTSPLIITVACLGDIGFVGWGGEVFNAVGKTVKAGSPFRQTFIFTHCNGSAGYVPTRPSYAEGGYEVQSSHFGPGAAEALADETLRMLKELHDAKE